MSEWKTRALGEVLSISHGYAFPGDGFSDDPEYPTLVTPRNFKVGGGFKPAKPKTYHGEYPPEYRLTPGDVIVTMTDLSKNTDTLGYSAVIPDDGVTYLHNQRIGKVRVKDHSGADLSFMSYFLRQRDYRSFVVGSASGSTVKHTSPKRIESYSAKFPPLDEQRRIASVLGAFDDLIETNRQLSERLLARARTEYDRLVTTATEEHPFNETVEVLSGGTPKTRVPEYWDGDIPWFSVVDAPDATTPWVHSTSKAITQAGLENSPTRILPEGTTIISARGTVGRLAMTAVPMAMNQSCYGLRSNSADRGDAFTYFSTQDVVRDLQRAAHGSVFDTITRESLARVSVKLPDGAALRNFQKSAEPLLAMVREIGWENEQLTRTRDELLPLLMSGKVRVEDVEIPEGAA